MKNNLFLFILTFFFIQSSILAESFIVKSTNIEILDKGNEINATNGRAISKDKNLEITSDKFKYLRELDILESSGNGQALIKSKKIRIKYDNAIFDQKNQSITSNGNVEIIQIEGNFIIKNDKIFYDQKNNIVSSNDTTVINDNFGNTHFVESFIFEIDKDLIKVKDLVTKDNQLNTFKTSLAYINVNSGKVFGKDIKVNLNTSSTLNENEYKLKGNSVIIDDNISEITKGVFTTCKKRDDCPPWQLSAKKITHNKKKREISYNDALLKIYDVPVAYFPKFFHPDPTVKRRTGFLVPSIKNSSNSNNYLNTPFFYAIAENKDITFSPRFYANEKILLQSEYRQKNLRSSHIADFSLFSEKGASSKNHFFYKFDKNLKFKNFDTSELDLKIQSSSSDTYIEADKLKSELITDNNILENSVNLDLYSNDLFVSINSTMYEDLDKKNNDRYEYILPNLELVKNLNNINILNGDFVFKSESLIRNYNTNIYEKQNINNIIFRSYPKINKFGLFNNYEFLIKNANTENKNSDYKNKKSFFLSGIYQFNSSLPLIKENRNYQQILKPRISLKVAPSHTKDDRNSERKIDLNNIYSLNRAVDNTSIEGGLSAAYGFDYSILDKMNTKEIINFKLASNLRVKKNDDLTNMNQIGEKMSNIFNEIVYTPNEFVKTKYISSIKNNLKDTNYQNFISEFKINNFVTTFDYLNENNTSDKNSYISNKTTYSLNRSNSFSFSTRKNKTKDLTEYYNFMYQYKNDCLAASIEYNKDFYSDRELEPNENVMFKLTIIPLAETTSPNLINND